VKFVLAPDSFKESMTAAEAARAMAAGIARVSPDAECDLVPMADGGEGLVSALVDALGGTLVDVPVHGPLGEARAASYGRAPGVAIIEVAAASGLGLVPASRRDPGRATTAGFGEQIRDALGAGARRFVLGLGGSATNDAGTGALAALGVRFLDASGAPLPPGGAALRDLAAVDASGLDRRLAECRIEVACDVDAPLCGPSGASHVFGPQKGASPNLVAALDAGLARWADVVETLVGRAVRDVPGAGAAGGLGAGLLAFLPQARLRPGVEIVAEAVGLPARLRGADWVFTGEGRIDAQTLHGKAPMGVLTLARQAGVPVIMFGGSVEAGAEPLLDAGATALVPIRRAGQTLAEAMATGPANLADAVEATVRSLLAG